ncbi:hypothetical protein Vretifemale_5146, partial [Volvox reticuliferus]
NNHVGGGGRCKRGGGGGNCYVWGVGAWLMAVRSAVVASIASAPSALNGEAGRRGRGEVAGERVILAARSRWAVPASGEALRRQQLANSGGEPARLQGNKPPYRMLWAARQPLIAQGSHG